MLSKSHHFFYFFIREHFSARKCSLCQTLACTDRRSHKQKLLLLWDTKLLKEDRDACSRFCFSNPHTFRNVEKASSVHFCLSLVLFNTNVLLIGQKKGKFRKFRTTVSSNCSCGHVKRNFDIFARNFIQEAELFSFSVQTCWRKNLFFLESSSQMVLPDRYIPALSNPQKKIVLTAKFFFAQFSHLRKTSFFSKENSFLKMPLGQVDNYFDNPLD